MRQEGLADAHAWHQMAETAVEEPWLKGLPCAMCRTAQLTLKVLRSGEEPRSREVACSGWKRWTCSRGAGVFPVHGAGVVAELAVCAVKKAADGFHMDVARRFIVREFQTAIPVFGAA